jgi:hypothetical protein
MPIPSCLVCTCSWPTSADYYPVSSAFFEYFLKVGYSSDMELTFRVQKSVNKIKVDQQTSDFAYWQTQPDELRLATLEQIRQEYQRWKYGTEPRLQRVYSIVKRT